MDFRNKLNSVGQTLKKAGIATGNGIVIGAKATASGVTHASHWIAEQYQDFQDRRQMIKELNDCAGDIASEISKFNSKLEVIDAAKALERHTILLRKVAKEMEQ